MRGPFPLFAATVLGAAAMAAGCGGDDSKSGHYREQASVMCTEAMGEAESAPCA